MRVMARFRRKSAGKQGPFPWSNSSRFLTSHLNPPSPGEHDWPPTPPLASDSDSKSTISSVFSQWFNSSSSSVAGERRATAIEQQHVPVDVSKYRLTNLTIHDYVPDPASKSPNARLPRYVPIIIPDFAQPSFTRDL